MHRFIYPLSLLLVLATAAACRNAGDTPDEKSVTADQGIHLSHEQFEHNGMLLGSLEERTFPATIHANGTIDVPPENRSVVSAIMGGYVKNAPLLIGDFVIKGQVLLTIVNTEFITLQQNYMEVKQQLAYLQSEYERQKTMVAENITSHKSFLKSESEYKTTLARFNGLRKQLAMLHISPEDVENGNITSTVTLYAPISGSITDINVNKGTYVSPASPILEIIDNDHIHIELSVFEKDVLKLKKGQKILFRIPEASTETYEGEVHLIGTSINENRTITVHGHPEKGQNRSFMTGMFVEASVVVDTVAAKALPSEAIVSIGDISYVLVLDTENGNNRSFTQTMVQVAETFDGYTVISNAEEFKPTDRFLVKGAFNLIAE